MTGFSGGAYREVFLSQLHEGDFVFKEYIWDSEYGKDDFEFMRMDAIVAEKLTWSSRIVDVYAFCALGMINEAMQNGDMEPIAVPSGNGRSTSLEAPEKSVKLKVENKLTGSQKLHYAWEMAEVSCTYILLFCLFACSSPRHFAPHFDVFVHRRSFSCILILTELSCTMVS